MELSGSVPAGNSIFFSVKRIEDPIGLLPAKLILGINKVRLLLHPQHLHALISHSCCMRSMHIWCSSIA